MVSSLLDYGIESGENQQLVQAASAIKAKLLAVGEQAYANWLENAVGELQARDTTLLDAIGELPFPIVTTNYDTLLEKHLNRGTTHWNQPEQMQQVLGTLSNSIGHIHGVWSDPSSAVFSTEDYSAVLNSNPAQALQHSISSVKSLIYIGCGEGLRDPNLGQLTRWHAELFKPSGMHHFRLCLQSEVESLEKAHAVDHITPVAFGDNYSDLPQFISEMASVVDDVERSPRGLVRDVAQDARDRILSDIESDLILGQTGTATGGKIQQHLLPPILLPVPHSEFVKQQRTGKPIEKIDPHSVVGTDEFIVIAAESETGLTTAIKWFALKSSQDLGTAAPLYLSFRECKAKSNPLAKRAYTAAAGLGLLSGDGTIIDHVLALDDVHPGVRRIFSHVMSDLLDNDAIVKIIGCRQGDEDVIIDKLNQSGHEPRLLYVGKLGDAEVEHLVRNASPPDAERLVPVVNEVLRAEHLPRTPFSVSLLVSVLLSGGQVASTASQTAILEEYVSLLLGRGDPHEDSRFEIDQPGREALLACFAEILARKKVSAVPEAEAVQFFDTTMKSFDWPDSAIGIIHHLTELRVLHREENYIGFARSSFLFLFAAKRANVDHKFRDYLLDNALYYSAVVRDYSALVRSDGSVLESVLSTLPLDEELATQRTPYAVLEPVDAPPPPPGDSQPSDSQKHSGLQVRDHDDSDLAPFPVDSTTDISPLRKLMRSLELTSTVLRDSDQVEDLGLKSRAFRRVLNRWGHLVSVMQEDPQYSDLIDQIAKSLHDVDELRANDPEVLEEIVDELFRLFPAAVAAGGIESTLASRKLVLVFQREVAEGSLSQNDESAIAACLFAYSLREPGWSGAIRTLAAGVENSWLTRNFILRLLRSVYESAYSFASREDEENLLEACVEIFSRATRYDSDALRKRRLDQLREEMRRRRTLARSRVKMIDI
nr:SIR2 family protein [Isoptericola sediminis]